MEAFLHKLPEWVIGLTLIIGMITMIFALVRWKPSEEDQDIF